MVEITDTELAECLRDCRRLCVSKMLGQKIEWALKELQRRRGLKTPVMAPPPFKMNASTREYPKRRGRKPGVLPVPFNGTPKPVLVKPDPPKFTPPPVVFTKEPVVVKAPVAAPRKFKATQSITEALFAEDDKDDFDIYSAKPVHRSRSPKARVR